MRKTIIAGILALLALPAAAQISLKGGSGGGGGSYTLTANGVSTATTCVDAGATDTYACDLSTAPTYSNGFWAAFQANTANTGPATINFNSVGALPIVRKTTTISTALVTGDIRADQWVIGFYDGTNFQCVSCDGSVFNYNTTTTTAFAGPITMASNSGTGAAFYLGGVSTNNAQLNSGLLQTPDAGMFAAGTLSNSFHLSEIGDVAFDFNNGPCGTSACTDPLLIIHSAVQDTTQYNAQAVWGEAGGAIKALTESSATALVRIPVATNSRASGELVYEIYATDGTDMQVRSSRIRYAMTNKAGTEACVLTASDGATANAETNDDNAASITAGTLTYGIACTNNAADTMDITFAAVSSLVQTTLQATWSVKHLSPGQPARQ